MPLCQVDESQYQRQEQQQHTGGPEKTLLFALVQARRSGAGQPIPFGPSISLAAAIMLLFGDGLIKWYMGLLGL